MTRAFNLQRLSLRPVLPLAGLALLFCLPVLAAEGGFFDPFDTDPFATAAPRWRQQFFHYHFFWTGGAWDPAHNVNLGGAAANLPLADSDTVCAFSTGAITVGSSDRRKTTGNYRVRFDFRVQYAGARLGSLTLGQRLNRQVDERDYLAALSLDRDGTLAWSGAYHSPAGAGTPPRLRPGCWYTLSTTVENRADAVRFHSEIRQAADDRLIARSPEFTDAAPARLQNAHGWGWRLELSPEGYWSRLVELDNFTVVPVGSPGGGVQK
jgi:hypothetical protein